VYNYFTTSLATYEIVGETKGGQVSRSDSFVGFVLINFRLIVPKRIGMDLIRKTELRGK
jgi:hypothetical protein